MKVQAAGDLSLLRRTPADLVNYISWTVEVRETFGSVLSFILRSRLHWATENHGLGNVFSSSSPVPFSDDSDFTILRNDWPYGLGADMLHLVAWTKTPIVTDEQGDPTPESRRLIKDFVEKKFMHHMSQGQHAGDNLQWFRNRAKWQSVRGLDHIHIVLRGADEAFVTVLTGQDPGDVICRAYRSRRTNI